MKPKPEFSPSWFVIVEESEKHIERKREIESVSEHMYLATCTLLAISNTTTLMIIMMLLLQCIISLFCF